jgi:hypothetical protein
VFAKNVQDQTQQPDGQAPRFLVLTEESLCVFLTKNDLADGRAAVSEWYQTTLKADRLAFFWGGPSKPVGKCDGKPTYITSSEVLRVAQERDTRIDIELRPGSHERIDVRKPCLLSVDKKWAKIVDLSVVINWRKKEPIRAGIQDGMPGMVKRCGEQSKSSQLAQFKAAGNAGFEVPSGVLSAKLDGSYETKWQIDSVKEANIEFRENVIIAPDGAVFHFFLRSERCLGATPGSGKRVEYGIDGTTLPSMAKFEAAMIPDIRKNLDPDLRDSLKWDDFKGQPIVFCPAEYMALQQALTKAGFPESVMPYTIAVMTRRNGVGAYGAGCLTKQPHA